MKKFVFFLDKQLDQAGNRIADGFEKIKNEWIAGLVGVIIAVPVIVLGLIHMVIGHIADWLDE